MAQAAEVAIERHTQIRGDVNPYDPKDERYFDQRLGAKLLSVEWMGDQTRRVTWSYSIPIAIDRSTSTVYPWLSRVSQEALREA